MTTLLRILRLYPLALWAGGEVFFVVTAGIAFKVLPDVHTAGMVVRGTLLALHRIGMCGGAIYLLVTLALLAMALDRHRVRFVEIAVVVIMLILTAYSQMSIIPRMETDRLPLGGDVNTAAKDNPARSDFDRLHARSVDVEGAVLIGCFVLLALTAVHGRRQLAESAS